ncbi:MAG: molybdopterin-synthase adenylyltransferase MoeB [Bauldia sp.]|nr:molybdopterin-synthase adenylyltransferase MoeB [Bauldia sp.]
MFFSEDEIRRYARHLVLADVGGPGQQKLKNARLLVIGAGGLGAPVLAYTAAAGVGTIGVVDHDTVSVSDLQRQVIYATDDLGMPKVQGAKAALGRLNPHVEVEPYCVQVTAANAVSLVAGYDIVADCTDNAETRYLISDACFHAKKTLVTAAAGQFDGSLTVLKPHLPGADGTPNPTYRCLFPRLPEEGAAPRCAEVGVLGVLTGLVGSLQALEIVKEIVGIGSSLVGQLLMIDSRALRFETIGYRWDPANPLNGTQAAALVAP